MKYIQCTDITAADDPRKTRIFMVNSTESGDLLGQVRWYAPWRKYCFYPTQGTIFEQVCMRDLSDFIETKTKEHKKVK